MASPVKTWNSANPDGSGDHTTPTTGPAFTDLERRIYGGLFEAHLASSTAVGATSITLDRPAATVTSNLGFVAIDIGTANCELRRVLAVSGANVTVTPFTGGGDPTYPLATAHSAGATVRFFQGGAVPAPWFGALGVSSTFDDEPGLQQGIRQCWQMGLPLDGCSQSYRISKPLIAPNFARWTGFGGGIRPKFGDYTPNDATNAMFMCQNGVITTFTSDASTDVITTTTAHGLTIGSLRHRVVFKGSSLPSGITAGRLYWAVAVTSTTAFKIALTQNGTPIDLGAGSGTVYLNLLALGRVIIDDLYLDGQNFCVNGMMLSQQQPSRVNNLRIDNCTGFGLNIFGQQCLFTNYESINCGTALELDDAAFMWFYGFNAEQCNRAVHVKLANTTFRPVEDGGGSGTCGWWGVHIEMVGGLSTSSSIPFDIEGLYGNLTFDNVWITNLAGQKLWWFHAGRKWNYVIQNVGVTTAASAGQARLVDDDRGEVLDFFPIDRQLVRYTRSGTTTDHDAWYDAAGAIASGVNLKGQLHTRSHAAPADADLFAGQLVFWFDQTDGAAKLMVKAKSANGTVRTGSMALT